MNIIYFIIALLTSTIGAISGIGGGVILKPLLDSMRTLDISQINFLSGCTVLTMSFVSLLKSRADFTSACVKSAAPIAFGSCIGGVIGKMLLQNLCTMLTVSENISIIQSTMLLLINILMLWYITHKSSIHQIILTNIFICIIIGLFLGTLSSFLGIGGGPLNIGILCVFFSMSPKQSAIHSLFIIFCSQFFNLIAGIIMHTIPEFFFATLFIMCIGGILGAMVGTHIRNSIKNRTADKILHYLLIGLISLNLYNISIFSIF
ncbi:MAG: sulfite exporter TauE/SafE family protein [Clostridium sp.]